MGKGYRTGFLVILFLILVIMGTYYASNHFFNHKKKDSFSVVVDKINDYGYTLDERDSKVMRKTFKELKKVLKKDKVDDKEYANLLAELYIIDLYDINNKVNKYDVPCLEYIYPNEVDKFKSMIKDDFYSRLEDNSDKDRKQELPTVKSISVTSTEEDTIKVGEEEKNGYVVLVEWTYDKDLGFDNKAKVSLVKDDTKLYVVKHTPIMD
ncbi:MAG: hypothetical protein K6G37_03570 [Bacilli bacterium]|nr:hypothetical protein [Bacilli bacterium]